MKRIRHNDLSWYFMRPREELPAAYVRKCEKFFKELSHKQQASSAKVDKLQAASYSRIIKEK